MPTGTSRPDIHTTSTGTAIHGGRLAAAVAAICKPAMDAEPATTVAATTAALRATAATAAVCATAATAAV